LVDVVALSNLGHRAGRLAGRENDQASGGKGRRQMRGQAIVRMRGGNRRAEQVEQKCAKRYQQGRSLVRSVCMIRDSVQAAPCHFHRSHAGDRLLRANARQAGKFTIVRLC
jgi:hypothetical protein